MNDDLSFAKISFILSFATFTLLYGFAACAAGWFPKQFLLTAWGQAEQTWMVSSVQEQTPGLLPTGADYLHPSVYDREGVRVLEADKVQPGLTLITADGEDPELKLIDRKGHVVHKWEVDMKKLADSTASDLHGNVHGSYLLSNGDLIINVNYAGTVRLDACGRVLWKMPNGHHSVERAEDGSFWIPAVTEEPQTESKNFPDGFPGLDKAVYLDKIRRVSKSGKIMRSINVLDILYENDLERYIPKSYQEGDIDKDVTHLNDVEPLGSSMADEYPDFETGDLLVSLKHLDLVFVFDPESKDVRWHASSPFIYQHDPDFIGDGWIGVFDNNTDFTERGSMLGGSRIVGLQPHTGAEKDLFPTPRSEPFYTPHGGKWQRLENGNLLLTEFWTSRIVEVAPDGRTIWDWVHESDENSKVPELSEGARYDLTRGDVASWPCASVDSTRAR